MNRCWMLVVLSMKLRLGLVVCSCWLNCFCRSMNCW